MATKPMRRALAWMAACLLVGCAGILLLEHLHPTGGTDVYRMSAPEAVWRKEEVMAFPWPEGTIDPNGPAEMLVLLDGIGPALAERICEERERNGSYVYPADLINVKGIGEKTLARFWDQLFLPEINR